MFDVSFFITTIASISWILFCSKYIYIEKIINQPDMLYLYQAIFILFLPILALWFIFSAIKSHLHNKTLNDFIYNTIKLNQTPSKIEKNLQNTLQLAQNEIAKISTFNEFNVLIADANEILADIIKRSNSISSSQMEHLWTRSAGGERWLIAKTFIEICEFQPEFLQHLEQKAQRDTLLKGSILEFYTHISDLKQLIKDSQYQTLFNILEYGAIGKVFNTLTPLAKMLYADTHTPIKKETKENKIEHIQYITNNETEIFPSFLTTTPKKTPTEAPIKETKEEHINNGLKAIRDELIQSPKEEPIFSSFSKTTAAIRTFSQTSKEATKPEHSQKIISLEELEQEINASPDNNYNPEDYSLGAWNNEKYSK